MQLVLEIFEAPKVLRISQIRWISRTWY